MREEFEKEVQDGRGWVVDPGLLGRPAWDVERAEKDVELLRWIGRFRFVTGRLVAERFGISWQRANARLRRLEGLGLVGFEQRHVCEARAVFLTGRGSVLLGGERRKQPRPGVHRDHELAVVRLATFLELRLPHTVVITERELRQLDRETPGRYRVNVNGPRNERARWPDLVTESDTSRVAVEVEFAPKATDRLRRILAGYRYSPYDQVRYVVSSLAMARRISRLADRERLGLWTERRSATRLIILPWPWLAEEQATAVVRATSAIYRHDYVPVRSRQRALPADGGQQRTA